MNRLRITFTILKGKKQKKDAGKKLLKKGTKLKSKILDVISPEKNSTTEYSEIQK
jgi:hypothetical protein